MISTMVIEKILKYKYPIAIVVFILTNFFTLNNLPWGDDFPFIFDSNIKDPNSPLEFWDPYSKYFKSWPMAYTILWGFLKLFGKKFFYFRLLNFSIHILNSYLVKKVSEKLIKNSDHKKLIVFFVTICFLFHPISQFTINWIFQIKTLLAMFFGLLTLLCIENLKKNNALYSVLAIICFFLALNSKIAVVLLPFYLLLRKKYFLEKSAFVFTTFIFFSLSTYYGLINIKGINAVWSEKKNIERSVVDYRQDEKVMEKEDELVEKAMHSQFQHNGLKNELATSISSLKTQIGNTDKLFEKIALNFFTLGRYINSSIGLNRYSLVYERNIDSFAPVMFVGFCLISFLYLWFFARKDNFNALFICALFFAPIGGLFYVPYMKISFISDHWFYLSLPFLLMATLSILKDKPLKVIVGIILIQSLFMSYHYRTSDSIIRHSIANYKNTFLDEYHARLAMEQEDFNYAHEKVSSIKDDYTLKQLNIIKGKLILNLKHIKNKELWEDAKDYISHAYTEKNYREVRGTLSSINKDSVSLEKFLINSMVNVKERNFTGQMYLDTFKLLTNGKSLYHVNISMPDQSRVQK
jgi:hypothetical protein